jgi:hypothetical protein
MSWHAEFGPSYEVPEFLPFLARKKVLEDTSWHNDISPSFSVYREIGDRTHEVRLWVDHPFKSRREVGGERYVVVVNENGDQVFESHTDDLDEAMETLFNKLSEWYRNQRVGVLEWRPVSASPWDDPVEYYNELKEEYLSEPRA